MSRLDAVLASHPLPTWRPLAWLVIVVVATSVSWSYFAKLDEVAIAAGEVIPRGKVKVIQHLEGGIITTINVREGDAVREGDILVSLDLGSRALNREELQARLDGERLRRVRLTAQVEDAEPDFPADAVERQPALANAELKAFDARRQELESAIAVLETRVEQRVLEVQELEARKAAVTKNLDLARRRLGMSTALLARKLTAEMDHLELQAEVESLEGELAALTPALPRVRAAVVEAEQRIVETRDTFRREAQEELRETEQTIARLGELVQEASRQGARADIRSPIDGIVKNIRYNTIGGVVSAGEPIMELVPTGDRLVVEARLDPTDRGYVEEGQRAVVKVTAYDFVRYGGLEGTVVHVAPDSSSTEQGLPFFRVIVETDKTHLGDEDGGLPIKPGMQATADIHTGTKSVLLYLVKPVLKLRHEAFRER